MNSDGFPEFYGACSGCNPAETKGYYQKGADATQGWTYHAVTARVEFPFGGTGWPKTPPTTKRPRVANVGRFGALPVTNPPAGRFRVRR